MFEPIPDVRDNRYTTAGRTNVYGRNESARLAPDRRRTAVVQPADRRTVAFDDAVSRRRHRVPVRRIRARLLPGTSGFGLVPAVSWITWTHIHFVTIGAFTQLLFGTLPQLAARKLERPGPSPSTFGVASVGLNVALVLVWYGRAFGEPLWFDIGLRTIWLLTSWLFAVVLVMVRRSDGGRARDPTIGFYLLSPFVYLIGLALAFGLYSHGWDVPGGWYGLREAHVHANAWGFLGLAAIGTLYDLFPRLVDAELYSERLKRYSLPLFALGIVPLVVGPVLGMGKTVTAIGLVLYAAGYVLYIYTLARTYWAGTPNGTALGARRAAVDPRPGEFRSIHPVRRPAGNPRSVDRDRCAALLLPRLGASDRARGLAAHRPLPRVVPGTARGDGSDSRVDGLVPEASPVGRRTEVRPRLEPRGPRRRDRLLLSGPVVVGATARLGIRRPPRTLGLLSVQNHRATVGGAGTCVAGLSAIPNSVGTSAVCTTIVWMGVHRCEQLVDHVSPTARRVIVGRRRSSVAVGERDSGASRYRTISG